MNDRFRPPFDSPFADTLAWAAAREAVLPDVYYGLLPLATKRRAFTASGLAILDQIQAILDSLNEALERGDSFAAWLKSVPDDALILPRHRLELIYRNAMQTAYNVGRTTAQRENKARRPYLMWDAINDSRTRDSHRAMDGYIAPIDDPIWQVWSAPSGFNCRCKRIGLSERQAIARGYEVGQLPPTARPDEGWGYEKADAPNEGLMRAIANRLAMCATNLAGAVVGLAKRGRPAWCDDQRFMSFVEKIAAAANNGTMATTQADKVIENLLNRAAGAPRESREVFFEALWKSRADLVRHINRRTDEGTISGIDDYITKTFNVLANADSVTLSLPFISDLKASAKVQIVKDGWIVLLTPSGQIVTSYLFNPKAKTFEQNEIAEGLNVSEQKIGNDYRETLAFLFFGR